MTALQPITTSSLAEIAFDKLVEAISAGEFQPGQRLSEADLARRFGISRGPLREALHRLEGKLVTRRARLGVSVISLSQKELLDIFRIREALEGMSARLAAEARTDEDVSRLKQIVDKHRKIIGVSSKHREQQALDDRFHETIIKIADSRKLQAMLTSELYFQIQLYRTKMSALGSLTVRIVDEHDAIIEAIKARDGDGAENAMRAHIRAAMNTLLQLEPRGES